MKLNTLVMVGEDVGRPEPDSDFCSKCREHTGFEWDEEAEGWLSVCCGYPTVDLGGG